MDPAGLLLSVASIAMTIDRIQQSYNATPSTLSLIQSQIRILETGIQRIQEWLHFTDPTSKAHVMHSLQDAVFTVHARVERLQEDLTFITRTGPKTSKMLGRAGSDQWVKTKFVYNEARMRRHLTDVRECVSLIHFTLSVCQLPVGHGAVQEIKELELGAKTLNRAHTSTGRQRESIMKEQDGSRQDQERSADFNNFVNSILDAEQDLPEASPVSEGPPSRRSSWETSISDLLDQDSVHRDRDELHISNGEAQSSATLCKESSSEVVRNTGRAQQSNIPYRNHSSGYSGQRHYPGFTSSGDRKGYVFNDSSAPAKPIKTPNMSQSTKTMQKSINRKPVGRVSVSEGSSTAIGVVPLHTPVRRATYESTLSPPPRCNTDNLFNEASRSLTNLTDDLNGVDTQEHVESPPPYVDPPSASSPHVGDVKRRHTQPEPEMRGEPPNAVQLVRENQLDLLRGLLKQGIGIDDIDPVTRRTALMEAAGLRRSSASRILINSSCRLHLKDLDGNTALHLAGAQGDAETCAMLLEAGAQLDEYNNYGETPICVAARSGHTDAVLCLLNSWTARKATGTALLKGFLEASKSGNVSTAEAFVERGIKPKKIKEAWQPIAYAAQSGSCPMIDFMLSHKCNLKERSPDGWTALHFAAKEGNTAVVEKLLAFKLSWKAQTKKSKDTALHLAIVNNQAATAMALILHKDANITMKDADDQQAIHHAVRNGDLGLTTTLLNRGAKADDPTEYGYTPMLLAAAYGHLPLVAELITRGVSIEERLASPNFKPNKRTNEAARKGYWAEIRWPHPGARPLHLVSSSPKHSSGACTDTPFITGPRIRPQRSSKHPHSSRCQNRRKRLPRLATPPLRRLQLQRRHGRNAPHPRRLPPHPHQRRQHPPQPRLPRTRHARHARRKNPRLGTAAGGNERDEEIEV